MADQDEPTPIDEIIDELRAEVPELYLAITAAVREELTRFEDSGVDERFRQSDTRDSEEFRPEEPLELAPIVPPRYSDRAQAFLTARTLALMVVHPLQAANSGADFVFNQQEGGEVESISIQPFREIESIETIRREDVQVIRNAVREFQDILASAIRMTFGEEAALEDFGIYDGFRRL